jgi:hypothetical protein
MRRTPVSIEQAVNGGQKKVALTHGGLKNTPLLEGLVGRVPNQIEDEINDLAARKNRPAIFAASRRHRCDSGFDWAETRQRRL